MRVIIVIAALMVGGCAEAIRKAEIRQTQADDAKCASFGYQRGTEGYSRCRLQLETNRNSVAAARAGSGPTSCTRYGNTVSCY